MKRRKLFCEYGPVFYAVSVAKERALRHLRDAVGRGVFAYSTQTEALPHMVMSHRSLLLRRLEGVDLSLQRGKAENLRLAAAPMNGLVIRPGEYFSFWRLVGNATAARGYQLGLTLHGGKSVAGVGGGLCQLANLIHWMVLQSPLTVTELHHHTDALFPDAGRRVPFGTGTSVFYNHVDYRFRNDTQETFQLRVWVDETDLCGELLCSSVLPLQYRIQERGHHYRLEGDGWYRCSEVWQVVTRRSGGEVVRETLVLKNHSKVLFDPALIPPDQIWHGTDNQEESCETADIH